MPFTENDGASIYWKLEGVETAPPLVLLNSIGTDMDLWDGLIVVLRQRHLILRLDTRGHGASSAPKGDYTLNALANDVIAVMEDAGLREADVAGISLGGMIGMQLALSHPERIRRLALICTSATMDRNAWQARIDTIRAEGMEGISDLAVTRFLSEEFIAKQPEVTATLRRALVEMDADGYAGCAAAIRDMTLDNQLNSIAAPAVVVTGTRDVSTPYDGHGDFLVHGIPGARHASIDAAHLASIEAPSALARLLEKFLLDENHG